MFVGECVTYQYWIESSSGKESEKLIELKKIYDYTERELNGTQIKLGNKLKENFVIRTMSKTIATIGQLEIITAVKHGIQNYSICLGCHILAIILKSPLPEKVLKKSFIMLCSTFHLLLPEECKGLINEYAPTLNYIMKKTALDVDELCGVFLGIQCTLKVTRNLHWKVDLPKPNETKVNRRIARNSNSYFIHVTDIHGDMKYALGSCGECDRIMCCQNSSETCTGNAIAGNWADYRKCDMRLEAVDYVFSHLKVYKVHISAVIIFYDFLHFILFLQDAKFMLLTGDYVAHNIWEVTVDEVKFYINRITDSFEKSKFTFRVFPTVGNHEAVPPNCIAPSQVTNKFNSTWLHQHIAEKWKPFLSENALKTLAK
ncbi:sphingomyelin phosphodiesterase-like protein 2 [Leptotrombidium deliense]|uniref:Sphingomyelin phosphodiesterase-like protein 2 n=1 Tax=Leptotrombidium deliense TaxID=299467 RepID=A0A443SJW1_9ACAR|nr:sphingomyelin phosphodiesterase-like protein 2 [Leptotrombidium deliense]